MCCRTWQLEESPGGSRNAEERAVGQTETVESDYQDDTAPARDSNPGPADEESAD